MKFIHIDKLSKEPIYQQLVTVFKEAILKAELSYGSLLPSEESLADAFGISRVVVRQAYLELTNLNLIESVKGKGSQVIYAIKLVNLLQNIDELPNMVKTFNLQCRVLLREKIHSNHQLKSILNIDDERMVYHSKRMYSKDGVIILIEDLYLPIRDAGSIDHFEESLYLMDWFKNETLKLGTLKTQIKVSMLNPHDEIFVGKTSSPIFKGKYSYFSKNHDVVAYQEIQMMPQHHVFNIEVSQ